VREGEREGGKEGGRRESTGRSEKGAEIHSRGFQRRRQTAAREAGLETLQQELARCLPPHLVQHPFPTRAPTTRVFCPVYSTRHVCPHTARCVSSCSYMCPHTATSAGSDTCFAVYESIYTTILRGKKSLLVVLKRTRGSEERESSHAQEPKKKCLVTPPKHTHTLITGPRTEGDRCFVLEGEGSIK
jgi:hypothetical protein